MNLSELEKKIFEDIKKLHDDVKKKKDAGDLDSEVRFIGLNENDEIVFIDGVVT